jgi:hypothetical protein
MNAHVYLSNDDRFSFNVHLDLLCTRLESFLPIIGTFLAFVTMICSVYMIATRWGLDNSNDGGKRKGRSWPRSR